MSKIGTNSPKHCGEREQYFTTKKLRFKNKKIFYTIISLLLSLVSFIFLVWLTLHPSNPHFSLTEADIRQLNLSTTRAIQINSSIQITLLSNNPNRRVGIYYDNIESYASYKGQEITSYTSLPHFYQGHEESNLLSASLTANSLPVAPSLGYQLQRDLVIARKLVLVIKMNGRLRWKVGGWVSGKYRFNVNCVAAIPFGAYGPLLSPQGTMCSITI